MGGSDLAGQLGSVGRFAVDAEHAGVGQREILQVVDEPLEQRRLLQQ